MNGPTVTGMIALLSMVLAAFGLPAGIFVLIRNKVKPNSDHTISNRIIKGVFLFLVMITAVSSLPLLLSGRI
ncbi:MAG: hypothetical protein EOM61_10770 [Bacteroidia bacterium]|nr:hypothetical protein [Bacteroidia bacterium]